MFLPKSHSIGVQLTLNDRLLAFSYFASAARNEFGSQVRDRECDAGNDDRDQEIVHGGHPFAVRKTATPIQKGVKDASKPSLAGTICLNRRGASVRGISNYLSFTRR